MLVKQWLRPQDQETPRVTDSTLRSIFLLGFAIHLKRHSHSFTFQVGPT